MAGTIEAVKVSGFLDDAGLLAEINEADKRLNTINTQIGSLETQVLNLKKQREIIQTNIKDIKELQAIISRLKLRETEGIK